MELYYYKATVDRVVDGDTIDASVDVGFGITVTQRFRIEGFDAPETYRPRNEAEKQHGERATERAVELLMNKNIIIKSSKVPGIYGRYAAEIILEDGRNFTEVMIREGYEKRHNY